ncbi:GMC oxidoreductase-domain-containing protein [Aspergillus undulatus]|uniref:GMC oxidoreductase-domain-containing protein n=1 Tax=Aspergillus undulatus TaxID=1810928 RepID=UPI003CCD3EFF
MLDNPLAKVWVESFKALDLDAKDPFYGEITGVILFKSTVDGPEVVAAGVEVVFRGEVHTIKAQKEVILCAGALDTPKPLELSGIGDEKRLNDLGISVIIHNQNVGENLQDHLSTSISVETVDGIETKDDPSPQKWTTFGMRLSDISSQGPPLPTCMMFLFPVQAYLHGLQNSFISYAIQPESFISLCLQMNLPFPRGSTRIASPDPFAKQSINPNYLSHRLGIEIMARNLLDLQDLHKISSLSKYIRYNGRRNHPDAFMTGLDSARRYLRDTAKTSYH